MSETVAHENPKSAKGFDLETKAGRARARRQLFWVDHGFLRAVFHNFHWISPEMARANQPSPEEIARYADLGIKTIINLRGADDSGAYWLEEEACRAHGVALVNAPLSSRKPPTKERILRAKEIFETIAYPALMHCKSGSDRASLMAVLYRHFREGAPIAEAMDQLSLKYLHAPIGHTGMMDFFFRAYLEETRASGKSFEAWVREDYDPEALARAFKPSALGEFIVDVVLQRE